jgi:outer membrane cobalamin receptor
VRHETVRPIVLAVPLYLLAAGSHAQQQQAQRFEETLVVTGSAEPVRLLELGRALDMVTRERIAQLPARTLSDALRLASGLDVSARGDGGVQTDFSLRGAAFGQTLVLVDGVRLNDAQAGHHNGDIPVPLDEVERIEVLAGPGSSLYGADAFGGVVQVITRDGGPRLVGRVAGGSFGYGEAALTGRANGERASTALSLAAQRSDGFEADRDYRILEARARVTLGRNTRLAFSHLDKDFGALGFYGNTYDGPAPSRERTQQSLASLDRSFSVGEQLTGSLLAFGRAHADHFVFDRRDPELSDNRHQSRALGFGLRLHRALGASARVSAGAETGADWVRSSSLGDRGYGRASLFTEAEGRLGPVLLRPGLRFDAYGRFGSALSPSLAASAALRPGLRWRASAGRAFRVPTFTELYYHDPNHQASPDLGPESAWGADTGLDLDLGRDTDARVTAFGRWESNVIDWVRPSATELWHTENVRELRSAGLETSLRRKLGPVETQARYAWLQSRAPALALQSKYALDFSRHAFGLDLRATLPGRLLTAPTVEYRRKADGRAWWLLDLRLTRAIGRFELYADGNNLTDARYQEVPGVDMPGRSFSLGVRAGTR